MYIGDDVFTVYPFCAVDFYTLHLVVIYNDTGDFTIIQHCASISADDVNHFRGHLHTSVNEPIGSLYVGVVNHGVFIEVGMFS